MRNTRVYIERAYISRSIKSSAYALVYLPYIRCMFKRFYDEFVQSHVPPRHHQLFVRSFSLGLLFSLSRREGNEEKAKSLEHLKCHWDFRDVDLVNVEILRASEFDLAITANRRSWEVFLLSKRHKSLRLKLGSLKNCRKMIELDVVTKFIRRSVKRIGIADENLLYKEVKIENDFLSL